MELDLSNTSGYGSPVSQAEMEPSYPCLYLTVDGIEDLPDSGTMKFKYRVKDRTMRETKGKEEHSSDIEILSIKSPKKQPEVLGSSDDEEAMEDL